MSFAMKLVIVTMLALLVLSTMVECQGDKKVKEAAIAKCKESMAKAGKDINFCKKLDDMDPAQAKKVADAMAKSG